MRKKDMAIVVVAALVPGLDIDEFEDWATHHKKRVGRLCGRSVAEVTVHYNAAVKAIESNLELYKLACSVPGLPAIPRMILAVKEEEEEES